ncbi:Coenzyme F420 hydrogenase/dehydrogenase, beta subunit C-terminal domain [Histidinibacterium lentulum]|uniref:Coenzyme F420 hydrogenase n=1 Tax=Histidinibacterium lentulum TaxID=2480588 RepID=A0A3N2RAA3_9RHOB|nr:Coenzyme F420 hydrogenase/dehydrogenase, beta subunit C-terminal domain [Histidinibacterium lentulum]ROU04331.1 coenzyme F420 hydrogenase [Histidinibacterium lentulum]
MSADPITRTVARNLCTGCGACAGAFPGLIRMVDDPVNGRRPVVVQSAEAREAAAKAVSLCAGAQSDWGRLPRTDAIDEDWGPVLAAWEGWASDDEIRHRGSSGGAVTALALHALATGTADGVAHVAARADDPRLNAAVISRDRAGLLRGAGSRYAQASPAESLGRIAGGTERVAFVGKPCDVASVHKAAQSDPFLKAKIPLTIAIFCAGAPNLVATDRLLDRLGVPKDGRLVDLRYRGDGWPGLMQAAWIDAEGTRNESEGISYAEGWGKVLQSERRWRCRVCADHTGAFADISVGDPWHAPPAGNTDAGRSLIVARTPRGKAFVEAAIAAGALTAEPRPRDIIARAQPNLAATHGAVWGRRLAMRAVGLPAPRDRGRKLRRQWLDLPRRAQVQSLLGTWKRVLRERLWRRVRIAESAQ